MRVPGLLGVACTMILAGCGTPPPVPRESAMARAAVQTMQLSAEGRPIHYHIYGYGSQTVLILAGIHGDEAAGPVLAKRLCTWLETHHSELPDRRVIVIPVANPDGLARNQRANANGVDLNRDFARPETGEPETAFLVGLIREHRPTRIISIHQPAGCVDWDGPGRDLAEAMARACGLPLRKLGAQPGSLGTHAGVQLGIPTVTLELPASASQQTPSAVWQRYGEGLLLALRSL